MYNVDCNWRVSGGFVCRESYGGSSSSLHMMYSAICNRNTEIQYMRYLMSHILEMWIYFRPRIASIVTVPLAIFFLMIVYFTIDITSKLQVRED